MIRHELMISAEQRAHYRAGNYQAAKSYLVQSSAIRSYNTLKGDGMRLLLIAVLLAAPSAAGDHETVELYCEGLHNAGSGAPVLQTHLWLKLRRDTQRDVIELQGPAFDQNSFVVEESPTTFEATFLTDDSFVETHIVLNRQTLQLSYSRRETSELDRAFEGSCTRYDPKL